MLGSDGGKGVIIFRMFSLLPCMLAHVGWLGVVEGVATTVAHDELGTLICSCRDWISPRRVSFWATSVHCSCLSSSWPVFNASIALVWVDIVLLSSAISQATSSIQVPLPPSRPVNSKAPVRLVSPLVSMSFLARFHGRMILRVLLVVPCGL
jgi:hypothetical protein